MITGSKTPISFLRNMMTYFALEPTAAALELFCAKTQYKRRCMHHACPKNMTFEPYGVEEVNSDYMLTLPITNTQGKVLRNHTFTISSLLDQMFEPDETGMLCAECTAQRRQQKGMYNAQTITAWPKVLVVQTFRNALQEGSRVLRVDNPLALAPYIRRSDVTYELVSYVEHIGATVHHGHYVAKCKVWESWFHFSDADVPFATILPESSQTVTLLFYKAI
jgi:ubiquitin C-terminal hydrolase